MKISELAKELKPYIVKWINESSGGTISGVANGNFAPTPHSISGYHHSGTLPHSSAWMTGLTDDTHTQYASADGSGTRSAYQSERLNKSILSGSGITGGGVLTTNQTLTLRTPGINLAASSTNAVNANGHTHAINAKSDVSATTTEDLLKSTDQGGLILKTLDVMGAVDILGGDLTVGSGMTLFVDESGNNVGIAGAPDPQFALDVNGPFHADAIYGPLGRILKDCIFLAHFDGPPDLDDYSGTPQTVQGFLPTTSSAIVYRPAKFGKGVQSGCATVNHMKNPIFGHSTWNTGWTIAASVTAELNIDKNFVLYGTNSAKLTATGSIDRTYIQTINVGNTGSYVLTAYVKKPDSSEVSASDVYLFYGGGYAPDSYSELGDGWWAAIKSGITGSNANVGVGVYPITVNNPIYLGGIQLEEMAYPTPLAHGDMIVGHSWSGTAHESSTTRLTSRLIYTTTISEVWSIGFWMKSWITPAEVPADVYFISIAYDADHRFNVNANTSGIYVNWRDNATNNILFVSSSINRFQDYHLAFTFNGSALKCYVNGVSSGSLSASKWDGSASILGIGNFYSGGGTFPGLIDDFYIVKRVQTDDDIGAIVDSEVPVVAEVGATSWYSGGTTPIWVDSDGFWMRDHTGLEVFGWSSVDNKSWGGVTLDAGDNLIGRYGSGSGGWMRWDRSAGQLKLGYSNACSMAFDGSGACIVGKLQMPGASAAIAIGTTPPTASNAGTGIWIDRGGLTSLVSSASQLKIDSSNGRLTTGSNSVVLDSNGITVIGTNKFRLFGTSSTCPTSPAATISMPYPAQYLEFTSTC